MSPAPKISELTNLTKGPLAVHSGWRGMPMAYFLHRGILVILFWLWSASNQLYTPIRSHNDDVVILKFGCFYVCMLVNEEVYKIPALYGSVKRHLELDCHNQDQIWDHNIVVSWFGLTTRSLIYIDSSMTYSLGQHVPTQTRNYSKSWYKY